MPYADKRCHYCGDFITNNNFRRHLRRWHPECLRNNDEGDRGTPLQDQSLVFPTRDRAVHPSVLDNQFDAVSADYVRDATICMLRRQEGNNVPGMVKYLTSFFPGIPEVCRIPVIVAAFTAAQKVAATHVDTHLSGDDERNDWAKRSLARWTHGLSAVEPESVHRDSSSTSLDSRSESAREDRNVSEVPTNLFDSRAFPVPLESIFTQGDISFDLLTMEGVVTTDEEVSSRDVTAVGVQVATIDVSAGEPSESLTSQNLLTVETEDLFPSDQFARPLSTILTPIASPRTVLEQTEEDRDLAAHDDSLGPDIHLFASPEPSLEEELTESRVEDMVEKKTDKKNGKSSAGKENRVLPSAKEVDVRPRVLESKSEKSVSASKNVSKEFRIPLKPRLVSNESSKPRHKSPERPPTTTARTGEKRRNEDRNIHQREEPTKRPRPHFHRRDMAYLNDGRNRWSHHNESRRSYDGFRQRLSTQEMECLRRMPRY